MKNINLIILVVCLFIACSKTDEDKASDLLEKANAHIKNNEWNSAKIVLDSIHQEYASLVEYRRMADTLEWKIQLIAHALEVDLSRQSCTTKLEKK